MASGAVVNKVSSYLKLLREQGLPVTIGVIYGSHARDDAKEDSDIDLLVISPIFDNEPRYEVGKLWRLAAQIDSHIEPIPVGETRYKDDDASPLLAIARRDGFVVS